MYFIYVNGFWDGFLDKTDANNITLFEKIFENTLLRDFKITMDLNKADILLESLFGQSLLDCKKWKYSIHYSGEPYTRNLNYDLILTSSLQGENIVNIPLFVCYIHNNNFLNRLIDKPIVTEIPVKFCCFIVSNGKCGVRNKMFDLLNLYKKVDSCGNFNNTGIKLKHSYWTQEYFDFIKQYKFIICFENSKMFTYSTEKIVNPYLAGIVPIYWSSDAIKDVFNKESMIFLEDETELSYKKVVDKVIELDKDDKKYLEYVNVPVLNSMEYWNNNYSIVKIGEKINKHLKTKIV